MNPAIILHVNYVEQGQSIDEMCRLAVRWGYDGIEFRRRRSGVQETPEEYLESIARAVEQTGLRHVLFGAPGPDLMSPDATKRRREIDECIAFYRRAAKLFPLTVCNTTTGELIDSRHPRAHFDRHGSALASDRHWRAAADGFRELGDLAAELGFRFAFETHMVYLHDLPSPTRRLVDAIDRPAVGINFDYGNIACMPDAPSLEESIAICAERTYMVHLKNHLVIPSRRYDQAIKCPLADGVINNRQLLRLLFSHGFKGPLVIEAPRPGDREWFAQEDLRYIRCLLADLVGA